MKSLPTRQPYNTFCEPSNRGIEVIIFGRKETFLPSLILPNRYRPNLTSMLSRPSLDNCVAEFLKNDDGFIPSDARIGNALASDQFAAQVLAAFD